MRISDWSSDVFSSDLNAVRERAVHALSVERHHRVRGVAQQHRVAAQVPAFEPQRGQASDRVGFEVALQLRDQRQRVREVALEQCAGVGGGGDRVEVRVVVAGLGVQGHEQGDGERSEEHTSELQSLMRISYAVFCLKKKTNVARQQSSDQQV